jgi:tetratricopeptide (TPR) repeat protein
MMNKRQIVALAMLVSVIMTVAPASAIFAGQAQVQATPAEELVELADRAEQQVKNLIDLVYANETALQMIEDAELLDELEGNVTLYNQGVGNLTKAHDALEIEDYERATDYATEAMSIFREVFSSIHIILDKAGIQKGHLADNQGLLEAMARALERVEFLRQILPENATETLQLLDRAKAYLDIDAAKALLLEGKTSEVISNLDQAKQLISQVYQYLKELGEDSDVWRIYNYCERSQERMRERFRFGSDNGINFSSALELQGYHSENEFMETLHNMIQTAEGKAGNIKNAMQDLEAIGQMVQEMDQALTQEINRYQNQQGMGGSGYGSGGSGSGSGSGLGGNGP